jgi:uncharacterized protein
VIAYVDSSVVVRIVMQQPNTLAGLDALDARATSWLTQAECLRTLGRARLTDGLAGDDFLERAAIVHALLRRMRRVAVSRSVLERAGATLPYPLKALDAIHLATALQFRESIREDLVFATHDRRQGKTAAALGFDVVGL